jgi:hypothetical protein
MTYSERHAITNAASHLFYTYNCHNLEGDMQERAGFFCTCTRDESPHVCPFQQLCQDHGLEYGCEVWEEMMGEDL